LEEGSKESYNILKERVRVRARMRGQPNKLFSSIETECVTCNSWSRIYTEKSDLIDIGFTC